MGDIEWGHDFLFGVSIISVEVKRSDRGFDFGHFKDAKGSPCVISERSCGGTRIFFGIDDPNPRIGDKPSSPIDVPLGYYVRGFEPSVDELSHIHPADHVHPADCLFNDRMDLDEELIPQVLLMLKRFANGQKVKEKTFKDTALVECSVKVTEGMLEIGPDDAKFSSAR